MIRNRKPTLVEVIAKPFIVPAIAVIEIVVVDDDITVDVIGYN